MRNLMSSAAVMRSVKKELIVIDLEDDDEDVLCDTSSETNPSDMQQICSSAYDDWVTKTDRHYMRLLDSFREIGHLYLKDNPLRAFRYEADNGGYDNNRIFKAPVTKKRSREDRNTGRVLKKNVESKLHVQASEEKTTEEADFELRRRESLVTEKSVREKKRSREDRNNVRVFKKNVESKPHLQASEEKTTEEADFELRRRGSLVTEKSVEAMLNTSDRNTICTFKKNVKSKLHVQSSKEKTTEEADFELSRRESLVTEKSVEAMLNTSHVKHYGGDISKKENSEDEMIVDEVYRSYLTGLLEKSKNSRTNSGKEIHVNSEDDWPMPLSDSDSDIIEIGDCPFLDEEDSPFLPSKTNKTTDLDEKNNAEQNSWFRKELMNILKQPFTETELKELHNEASVRKPLTRCRQLLDGRELIYETKEKSPSYLDGYPEFKTMYIESLRQKDGHKALNLLRGFVFYFKNIVQDDAFKPWLDHECLKITCFKN